MQKVVLKLDMRDEKDKKNAMEIVSGIAGVHSIVMNTKQNKLMTVTGAVDPAELVMKLRELVSTDIISVGRAKKAQKDDNRSNKNEQSEDSTSDMAECYHGPGPPQILPFPNYYLPPCTCYQGYEPIYYRPRAPPPLYHYGRYVTGEEDDQNMCVIC